MEEITIRKPILKKSKKKKKKKSVNFSQLFWNKHVAEILDKTGEKRNAKNNFVDDLYRIWYGIVHLGAD